MFSSSDSSSDDLLYSESSVFSESLYLSLVSELSPKPQTHLTRPSGLKLFQGLGINVTRLLLTYFSLADFLRVTTVCKWFYRVGNDPVALAAYASAQVISEVSAGEVRTAFAEKYRETALRGKFRPLYKDVVFDEKYLSVIHARTIAARLILFSLYEGWVYVWECVEGKARTISVYNGVEALVDSWVGDDGAVLIGRKRLVYIESRWVFSGFEERKSRVLDFSSDEHQASVSKIPNFPYIVLSRKCAVTIYNGDLECVRGIELTAGEFSHGKLFTPVLTRPVVVILMLDRYLTCDVESGKDAIRKTPPLQSIEKVDILTFPDAARSYQYLLLLGFYQDSFYLYANSSLLTSDVITFHVHHQSLLVFIRPYKFHVYTASISTILLTHTVSLLPSITYNSFLYAYSKLVCVQSARPHKNQYSVNRLESQTKVWFSDVQGKGIITDVVQDICVDRAFATRNEVVLVGPQCSQKFTCVVIIRYTRDDKDISVTIEEKFERFCKEKEVKWITVSEKEKHDRAVARRKERREERRLKAEKKLRRGNKHWKQKTRRLDREWLRFEVRSGVLTKEYVIY